MKRIPLPRLTSTIVPAAVFGFFMAAHVGNAAAQSRNFTPAQFVDESELERSGVSPRDLARGKTAIAIRCQSFVETDGSFTWSYCLPPNIYDDQRIARKIVRSLEDERIRPASIDGVPVRVLMNFMVLVDCAAEPCSIRHLLHHGLSRDTFGDDYSAPQAVLTGLDWYTGYADKLEWIDGWMPNMSRTLNQSLWPLRPRFAVAVAADGEASGSCIHFLRGAGDDNEQRNRQMLQQALSALDETRFIPGFHEGRPVPMPFFESAVLRTAANTVSARRLFDQAGRIVNRLHPRELADRTEAPELYCSD